MPTMTEEEVRARKPCLSRDLRQSDSACPAANVTPEGVYCGIEGWYLKAAEEPSSLANFCLGDYTKCSTWRAQKQANWKRRKLFGDRDW